MRPPAFDYHLPGTLQEACELKAEHGAGASALAGGQSLIPLMGSRRASPRALIDIKRIPELQGFRREDGTVIVGAALRQSRLHDDPDLGAALPVLADASRYIGHLETRHRGTVGGSLAHADPVAELPTAAVALDAQVVACSVRGERRIPAAEFLAGARRTTLAEDELVVEIAYPALPAGTGWAFAEIARRHGDPAMATAVALVRLDGEGAVASAAVTVGAVAGRPRPAEAVTGALLGHPPTNDRIAQAALAAADLAEAEPGRADTGPTPHPPRVPLRYRRRLAAAVTARALTQAVVRAQERASS